MKKQSLLLSLCATSLLVLTACPQPNTPPTGASPEPGNSASPEPSPSAETSASPSSEPGNPEPSSTATPSPTASGTLPATSPSDAPEVNASEIAAVELSTSNRYLTQGKGDTAQLTVTLKDKSGQVVSVKDVVLEWVSSRPSDFSIDANGLATALVAEGYTEITVTEKSSGLSATLKISVSDTISYSGGGGGGGGGGVVRKTPPENLTAHVNYNGLGRGEFLNSVMTTTTSLGGISSVASDDAGNFVTVWSDDQEIYGQRYSPNGSPMGPQFQVNTLTSNRQNWPTVAMDNTGDFVVAWMSDEEGSGSFFQIHAQRFDAQGDRQGLEWRVSDNSTSTINHTYPRVAMDADGDFVVTWVSGTNGLIGPSAYAGGTVLAQRYNSDGGTAGSEFTVFASASTSNVAAFPSVAMDDAGDFVIAWNHKYDNGDKYTSVSAQRYNAAGVEQGSEFLVSPPASSSLGAFFPSVAMDASGDFVVAWNAYGMNGYSFFAKAQRYNSAGVEQGSEFTVHTSTETETITFFPSVAMDSSGDFVVTWVSKYTGVGAQRYDASGVAQGDSIQVSMAQQISISQTWPAVAMDMEGDFVVSWNNMYGSANRIFNHFGQPR